MSKKTPPKQNLPEQNLPEQNPSQKLPPDTLNEQIGVFTRREVEARILRPLVDALSERFGREAVLEVLRDTVIAEAHKVGATMRERQEDDSIEAFSQGWEPWFRGGALEITELKRDEKEWRFNVTRCRYAELYQQLGMADLGATLSCNRDGALVDGFADDIDFERTQTIMQGASHCDFHYRKKD